MITKQVLQPDGSTLGFHSVVDVEVDLGNSLVTVTLGSWLSEDLDGKPSAKSIFKIAYPSWLPEYFDALEGHVSAHPDWTGGSPVRPSSSYYWNPILLVWQDPRTLPECKTAKWESIKSERSANIDAPLVTPYGTFDCGAKDRTNITDAVLLLQTLAALGTPTTIDFTLADNSTVTLTTTEMVTVGLLLGQKVQAAHANARSKRAEIEAATTKEQIDAVVW